MEQPERPERKQVSERELTSPTRRVVPAYARQVAGSTTQRKKAQKGKKGGINQYGKETRDRGAVQLINICSATIQTERARMEQPDRPKRKKVRNGRYQQKHVTVSADLSIRHLCNRHPFYPDRSKASVLLMVIYLPVISVFIACLSNIG